MNYKHLEVAFKGKADNLIIKLGMMATQNTKKCIGAKLLKYILEENGYKVHETSWGRTKGHYYANNELNRVVATDRKGNALDLMEFKPQKGRPRVIYFRIL